MISVTQCNEKLLTLLRHTPDSHSPSHSLSKHPKPAKAKAQASSSASPSKCKRPMNAFMLFAKKFRVEYTQMYPGKDNRWAEPHDFILTLRLTKILTPADFTLSLVFSGFHCISLRGIRTKGGGVIARSVTTLFRFLFGKTK